MTNQDHVPVTKAATPANVTGEFVTLMGEPYYRIQNYDSMPPFFITVVSSDDHWIFVATTGGLSAGRVNANHALFPYYTVDRVTENAANTGSKTILHATIGGKAFPWEPFIPRHYSPYVLERTLYKDVAGTALIFEEVNVDLGLVFRYAWRTSAAFGIVKTAWLVNRGADTVKITVTDGIQNVLPAHVSAETQNEFSVLLDAYKRTELDAKTGLGIYSLSSRLTDLAEPSEALRANTVWQAGLKPSVYLLSSQQLDTIRAGGVPTPEADVRGQRGAYFVHAEIELAPNVERTWHLVAEVDQDGATVANLARWLHETSNPYTAVEHDIAESAERLRRIVGGADGVQVSGDRMSAEHHFANVLFNVMRGGTFADQYRVTKTDFLAYVRTHDRALPERRAAFFSRLPNEFTVQTLRDSADAQDDMDLTRLCYAYLPLTFSRRHGDPSRPWNRFSIDLKNADGSAKLNYEGNWRDIFQNWEALAYTYPAFLEGMITVFLNATTIDGYNPYRITQQGIDWEVPEPSNPWANIGYWSDHQIIYLQKLLEACERFYPGKLREMLQRPFFAYGNVPYRIKAYDEIVLDPYNTIDFDWDAASAIEASVQERGTDGKLLADRHGQVVHVTLAEKLLNLLLAKLVNFVPDGGIWMNTQRPEWNDANNALVGKGLSVVTACYLRRFVAFFQGLLTQAPDELVMSQEVYNLVETVQPILAGYQESNQPTTEQQRRTIMDALGKAGSDYRWQCYQQGISGNPVRVDRTQLSTFLTLAQGVVDRTISANQRDDALYHAYNTLHLDADTARVDHLQVMLEGQVAVLSSGLLEPDAVLTLLQALRESALYRENQQSYILYPDRELPGFFDKNIFDEARVAGLQLVQAQVTSNDPRLIVKDVNGKYHFGGDIRNARDLYAVLETLAQQPELTTLVSAESAAIHELFEQVFQHEHFTGRSGSFFAYEGLGSIYWHMVSKLLLAVQENVHQAAAMRHEALAEIIDVYYDVRSGLGFNKSPDIYGAFPLDPYSHTPRDQGAKQPGMTGMVKEEILTRLRELGIDIENGEIVFQPVLIRPTEWLTEPAVLSYWDTSNQAQQLEIPAGAFAFTLCRVPVVVKRADHDQFEVQQSNGVQQIFAGHRLDAATSQRIFAHDGFVRQITVFYNANTPAQATGD